jgi:hypothetical protein
MDSPWAQPGFMTPLGFDAGSSPFSVAAAVQLDYARRTESPGAMVE